MPSDIRFARLPEAVLLDPALKLEDLKVYAILALHVFSTNLVWIGQRRISELADMDRRNVRRSLVRLAQTGHISCAVSTLGKRNVLQLNSKIFGGNSEGLGAQEHPLVGAPQHPRLYTRLSRSVTAMNRSPGVG